VRALFDRWDQPSSAAALEELQRAHCSRAVHWIPSVGRAGVERGLEGWEAAIAELTGEA